MSLLTKKQMNFAYGMGAAVVIIGALFKIQHWTGASLMLIVGLSVEALIFGLSAFDPVDKELDWSLVYPELAGGEAKERGKKEEAKEVFEQAYKMFTMFFALRLKIINIPDVKNIAEEEKPWTTKDIVNKMVDCCKE